MIKSIFFSQRIDPQHGEQFSYDLDFQKTRDDDDDLALEFLPDLLRQNVDDETLWLMILVQRGRLDKFDDWGGDTCWLNIRKPICEIEHEYLPKDRKARVYLTDLIEMTALWLDTRSKAIKLRNLKNRDYLFDSYGFPK